MMKYFILFALALSLPQFVSAQEQCYCYPFYAQCLGENSPDCIFAFNHMCFTNEIGSSDANGNGISDDVDAWNDQFKENRPDCDNCEYSIPDNAEPVVRDCTVDPNYVDNSPRKPPETLSCGFYTLDDGKTVCTGRCPVNSQESEDGSVVYHIGSCEHTPGEISTCGCVYDEYKTIIDSGSIDSTTTAVYRPAPVQNTDSSALLVAGTAIGLIALVYFIKK